MDGRNNDLHGGPVGKNGSMDITVLVRKNGKGVPFLRVQVVPYNDNSNELQITVNNLMEGTVIMDKVVER